MKIENNEKIQSFASKSASNLTSKISKMERKEEVEISLEEAIRYELESLESNGFYKWAYEIENAYSIYVILTKLTKKDDNKNKAQTFIELLNNKEEIICINKNEIWLDQSKYKITYNEKISITKDSLEERAIKYTLKQKLDQGQLDGCIYAYEIDRFSNILVILTKKDNAKTFDELFKNKERTIIVPKEYYKIWLPKLNHQYKIKSSEKIFILNDTNKDINEFFIINKNFYTK